MRVSVGWLWLPLLALSLAVSAVVLGPLVGVELCLALLVHETGHYLVARLAGLARSGPLVVGPLGGLVLVAPATHRRAQRAEAAIIAAGPLMGVAAGWGAYAVFAAAGDPRFAVFAVISLWLNALNLLPVGGLDGGRLAALAGLPRPFGLALGAGAALVQPLALAVILPALAIGSAKPRAVPVGEARAVRRIATCGWLLAACLLLALECVL